MGYLLLVLKPVGVTNLYNPQPETSNQNPYLCTSSKFCYIHENGPQYGDWLCVISHITVSVSIYFHKKQPGITGTTSERGRFDCQREKEAGSCSRFKSYYYSQNKHIRYQYYPQPD